MNQEIIDNIMPDATGTYSAIRNSGYENKDAVADLIDNSIDAGAKNIRIFLSDKFANGQTQVIVADDGCGMDIETLQQALRLGSTKNKNGKNLGKYGFGLKAASLSIGRRVQIVTLNKGHYSTAIFDLDQIFETEKFYAEFRGSSENEIQSFIQRVGSTDSGTVVTISNCDRIATSISTFENELKDFIRRVFRIFMRKGHIVYVNGYSIQYNDPLWLDDPRTTTYLDEDLSIVTVDGEEKSFHVLAVAVPDLGAKGNLKDSYGMNIKNQGFYFMRNNREIAYGVEIPEIFKKHNDYNLFRIELCFGSELDDEMNINYTKHNASPNGAIVSALKMALSDTVNQVRKIAKEKQKNKTKKTQILSGEMEASRNKTTATDSVASAVSANTSFASSIKKPEFNPDTNLQNQKDTDGDYQFVTDIFDATAYGSFKAKENGSNIEVSYNLDGKFYKAKVQNSIEPKESKELLDVVLSATMNLCIEKGLDPIDFINSLSKKIDG